MTIINVTVNKADTIIDLDQRLDNVDSLKLKYFRMVNCKRIDSLGFLMFPPDFVYLELSQMGEEADIINHPLPSNWTTSAKVPPTTFYSLQFRPVNQTNLAYPNWSTLTIEGHQDPCLEINGIRTLSRFRVRFYDKDMKLLEFDVNTVAQLTFKAKVRGPNVLTPNDRLHLYNKNQT